MQTCKVAEEVQNSSGPQVIANRSCQFFEPMNGCWFVRNEKIPIDKSFAKDIVKGLGPSELSSVFKKLCLYVHRVARMASVDFEIERKRKTNDGSFHFPATTRRRSIGPTTIPDIDGSRQGSRGSVARTPRRLTAGEVAEDRVSSNSLHSAVNKKRLISDAEIRSVYVMFIRPAVDAVLTGHIKDDLELFKLLNDIMIVVRSVLDRFQGDLIQFCRDDQGVVIVATFGLRGSTFPNMVAERGLPATMAIQDTLKDQLNVDSRMGATIGKVYCGVVGGVHRHGFSVLGPSVNLAARLMTSPTNDGFLVSNAVRLQATKWFDFRPLPAVKAKGYRSLIPIFEPTSALDRGWTTSNVFVGRSFEIEEMLRIAERICLAPIEDQQARMILVHAESGLGKSTTVYEGIMGIRRWCAQAKCNAHIAKSVCDENEELVPFSAFRSVFLGALSSYNPKQGLCSKARWPPHNPEVPSGDMADALSMDDGTINSKLLSLCDSMGLSEELAKTVAETLLGIDMQIGGKQAKRVKSDELVEFVVGAFLRCISPNDLQVIAIDDVQWMDWCTWKVLERLFGQAKNLMIVLISRPLSDYKLQIDPAFWKSLQEEMMSCHPRYNEFHIQALTESEIFQLVAQNFGVNPDSVDAEVARVIYSQSGGMPAFAAQLVENAKRNKKLERTETGILKWSADNPVHDCLDGGGVSFATLGQLMLHRFDSMGTNACDLLQICAVLGLEFTLNELKMILEIDFEALQQAVNEQILAEVVAGVGLNEDNASISYRFRHALWRNCILGAMLDEQKRELHHVIARAYESEHNFAGKACLDTRLMLKVFHHWKGAGQSRQASELALLIGECLEKFGLQRPCLASYKDALSMWKETSVQDKDFDINVDPVSNIKGFQNLSADDLAVLLRLKTAMGKCYASILEGTASAHAYQCAYKVLVNAPASAKNLKDRSIVFPIFSGLCLALKWGNIQDDNECSYEQELVQRFVNETVLHSDPVHIARAVAMQANLLARIGKLKKALEVQRQLECTYDADEHSAGICKCYGSDRAAQSFALATQWYEQIGQHEMADAQVETCLKSIIPKMDEKNVHNSAMILYPLIWIMKDRGMALKANEIFQLHVVDKFRKHFGEGKTTACIQMYEPISMLLGLAGGSFDDEPQDKYTEMVEWAMDKEPGYYKSVLETALGQMGRDCSSVRAEICLLLAKKTKHGGQRKRLLTRGIEWLQASEKRAKIGNGFEYAYLCTQLKTLSDELLRLSRIE